MSNELKPCPFCGAKPLMYDLLDTHGGFSIECPTDGCDAEKMKRTKEAAISAWNTRAPVQADAERAAAYDKIDRFLRNELDDVGYAEYSQAMEVLWGDAPPQDQQEGQQ